MRTVNEPVLPALCGRCRDLIASVGTYIYEAQGELSAAAIEQKADRSLVSFVDREAERRLITGLQALLPGSGFVAEESHHNTAADQAVPRAWTWVIDPLDGTTNYLHGLPVYAISVALQHEGTTQIGIIYDISCKRCYWAVRGEGAFVEEQRLSVSNTERLEDLLLAVGFYYADSAMAARYSAVLTALSMRTRGWRRLGSAALQLAYVAEGRFDAYVDTDLQAWDVAAGQLLIEEAGGKLTRLDGTTQRAQKEINLLAAGAAHSVLLRFLTSSGL